MVLKWIMKVFFNIDYISKQEKSDMLFLKRFELNLTAEQFEKACENLTDVLNVNTIAKTNGGK